LKVVSFLVAADALTERIIGNNSDPTILFVAEGFMLIGSMTQDSISRAIPARPGGMTEVKLYPK